MKKRDKNIAGILALFFGWIGVHRYYLGEKDKGLFYTIGAGLMMWGGRIGFLLKVLWVPFIMIVCLVDAISLFAMDQRRFDEKYNNVGRAERPQRTQRERRSVEAERRRYENREKREAHRKRTNYQERTKRPSKRHNPFKKSGLEKFNEYDYAGAIGDFKKSLELAPNDIASHFNIACAYSLTENSEKAFHHLDRAVALGFKDFYKIKNHHALAYLRIQEGFDEFQDNGFRLRQKTTLEQEDADLLNSQPDLLDQLKKLGELRQKGLLTELEFQQQKKKLMG